MVSPATEDATSATSPSEAELALLAQARAAHPGIAVDADVFLGFLRTRADAALVATHLADVVLALACARGDAAALRILERDYFQTPSAPSAPHEAPSSLLPPRHRADAAEVLQLLRHRLLVPDADGRVRIGEYSGRGSLRAWLRVAAVRVALNLHRGRHRERPLEEDRELANRAAGDLEITHLKARYRREFKEAFSAALGTLEVRDRNLLRQHYLDGLTMDTMAPLYRVHRITIVRWMERARTALGKATRHQLASRLQVERTELESILRLIDSQLEMSVRAFLEKE
jgi:RNA polymerase sigma-70 factor (ECF subfamily)